MDKYLSRAKHETDNLEEHIREGSLDLARMSNSEFLSRIETSQAPTLFK